MGLQVERSSVGAAPRCGGAPARARTRVLVRWGTAPLWRGPGRHSGTGGPLCWPYLVKKMREWDHYYYYSGVGASLLSWQLCASCCIVLPYWSHLVPYTDIFPSWCCWTNTFIKDSVRPQGFLLEISEATHNSRNCFGIHVFIYCSHYYLLLL